MSFQTSGALHHLRYSSNTIFELQIAINDKMLVIKSNKYSWKYSPATHCFQKDHPSEHESEQYNLQTWQLTRKTDVTLRLRVCNIDTETAAIMQKVSCYTVGMTVCGNSSQLVCSHIFLYDCSYVTYMPFGAHGLINKTKQTPAF